jgi:hypothetical protein
MKNILLFSIIFVISIPAVASPIDSLHSANPNGIQPEKLAMVVGGTMAIVTAAHIQNYNSWWKGERSGFHLGDGGVRTLGDDKFGHFYFTYLSSDILWHSFRWAGVEKQHSLFLGAGLSLAFQLYVEVEDGFTKVLGFSAGDAIADVAGAFYPLLQSHVSWFENVRFKWSCYPSSSYRAGKFRTIIDDYESMYFWLSFNNKIFPEVMRSYIPTFLGIAIGYGVTGLNKPNDGRRELFISLDYDCTRLPGEGSFLETVKYVLNYIHFPAPTIRLTPSVVTYGLHF